MLPKGWELVATGQPRIRRGYERSFELPVDVARFARMVSGSIHAKAHVAAIRAIRTEIAIVRGADLLLQPGPHRPDPDPEKHAPTPKTDRPSPKDAKDSERCAYCRHEKREHSGPRGACAHDPACSYTCASFTLDIDEATRRADRRTEEPGSPANGLSARDVERARRAGVDPHELGAVVAARQSPAAVTPSARDFELARRAGVSPEELRAALRRR